MNQNSATRKQLRYEFTVVVEGFRLNVKASCQASVVWKIDQVMMETRNRRELTNGAVKFDQHLTAESTVWFDASKKLFEAKKTMVAACIHTEKGTRQAGQVELDLASLLNKRIPQEQYTLPLQKCPDTSADITLRLKAKFKEEIKPNQAPAPSSPVQSLNIPDFPKSDLPKQESVFTKKEKVEMVGSASSFVTKSSLSPRINLKPSTEESLALQSDNKRLKQELKMLKRQNEKMKAQDQVNKQKSYEMQQNMEKMKRQIEAILLSNTQMARLETLNKELEAEILRGRIKLATIFNKAAEIGGPNLTDSLQAAGGFIQNSPR